MGQVHQLNFEDRSAEQFEDFWKWYPLKRGKAKARALFKKITAPGGMDTYTVEKDSGMRLELHLEATPQELIDAAQAFWKTLPRKAADSYTPDTTYCPHATTWLNQGRWEDE